MTTPCLPPPLPKLMLLSIFPSTPSSTSSKSSTQKVIKSTINLNQKIGTEYGFKRREYATRMVSFSETKDFFNPESCCFNSGAGITLVDQQFFERQISPKISICIIATPITIRGIGTTQHTTDEYAIIPFMFEGTQKEELVLAKFWQEVYLIDNPNVILLIGIDIMGPELVVVDIGQKKVILGSCNVEVPIEIKFRS